MSTPEINKWFSDTFGVDPGVLVARIQQAAAAASAPNRSVDPASEPNQSVETDEGWLNETTAPEPPKPKKKNAVKGATTFNRNFFELKKEKVPLWGGRLTAGFGVSLAVTGTIGTVAPDAKSTTTIGMSTNFKDECAASIAKAWADTEGVTILGLHTAFTETDITGVVQIKEGISVLVKGSGKLACGVGLSFEAVLVKVGEDGKIEKFKVSGGAEFGWFPVDPKSFDLGPLVKATDIKVQPTLTMTIEPNWTRLWAEFGQKVITEAAIDGAVEKTGETALSSAGVDLAIASGFLVIAAACVAASVGAINDRGDAAATQAECIKLTRMLMDGYKLGLIGAHKPPLTVMEVGYAEGMKARGEAVYKLRRRYPDITEDQVNEVLATVAERLAAQARPEIEAKARVQVWIAFASTHRDSWLKSYEFARWTAWSGLFGRAPNNEKLYTDYAG